MKKAQGLPLTTIIIAALGIFVLIILIVIFTGRVGIFGKSLSTCPGECLPKNECSEKGGASLGPGYLNPNNHSITCSGDEPKASSFTPSGNICCLGIKD